MQAEREIRQTLMIHVKIDNETTTDRQRYIQTDRDDIRPEATTEQHLSFHGSDKVQSRIQVGQRLGYSRYIHA